jgi:hypothetical protein
LLKLADEDMYRAKLKRKPDASAADQSKSGPLAA